MPCKETIPHLVQMHRRFKEQGLVVVTVNLDALTDEDAIDGSVKFLREKKVAIPNFQLDEEESVWRDKLHDPGFPCLFVFNRAGKIEERHIGKPKPPFDAMIEKLLKEKAP